MTRQTWKGIEIDYARMRPELKPADVPPCRICGAVPARYHRLADGAVQCLDLRDCYRRADAADGARKARA